MKPIQDGFAAKLHAIVPLEGKHVLEIYGTNARVSNQLVEYGATVVSIDIGLATRLPFDIGPFDITIFLQSLYESPSAKSMELQIDEAARVTRPEGRIVFCEPTDIGTYHQAERRFNARDGDTLQAKQTAHLAMQHHPRLRLAEPEFFDEAVYLFDSTADFLDKMKPLRGDFQNFASIPGFLADNRNRLVSRRRINIYSIKP